MLPVEVNSRLTGNLVPRIVPAFKMAKIMANSRSRVHKLANHKPAAILKQRKSPIFLETRDLLFARVFSSRRFEGREDPGDEVGLAGNSLL